MDNQELLQYVNGNIQEEKELFDKLKERGALEIVLMLQDRNIETLKNIYGKL
jgi:hypothetical protein